MLFDFFLVVNVGIRILGIRFMAFIIWDLAKKSQAGKFGTLVLFGALGLGVVGFLVKTIIAEYLGA